MSTPVTTIASEDQYKAWAAGQGITTAAPANLATLLAASTSELQRYCGREFLPSPAAVGQTETRAFLGRGGRTLPIDDALTISAVTVAGSTISPNLYVSRGQPITSLVFQPSAGCEWPDGVQVLVTGRFGYAEQASLPPDLVEACCQLTALRALRGGWGHLGTGRVTVINVTVESNDADYARRRDEALALAAPYRRLW